MRVLRIEYLYEFSGVYKGGMTPPLSRIINYIITCIILQYTLYNKIGT